MKSYFSQLAKQSGIRFVGRNEKVRETDIFAASPPASLHQDETVLIAPELPNVKTSKSGEPAFSENHTESDRKSAANRSPRSINKISETETEKAKSQKKDSENMIAATRDPVEPQLINSIVSPVESADSVELQAVEQVIFQETVFPFPVTAIESAFSEKVEDSPPQKEHFRKTEALLETGNAGKSEIQRVLLQEIQEWAAVAPDSDQFETETTGIDEKTSENEKAMRVIRLPTDAHEPFALRDTRGDNEGEMLEPVEQNFSLSIGTISIIVEEAEKPALPEVLPPKIRTGNTMRETRHRFPRLSRHYL